MSTRKFITPGDVFGRLTVVAEAPKRVTTKYWLCQCICGNAPKEIKHYALLNATSKSCGCLHKEAVKKMGQANKSHGMTHTPEFKNWTNMWDRCTNPNNKDFERYKYRTPTSMWRDFAVFISDMGLRPSKYHSIERLDNEKGYSKENCVWATADVQAQNRKNTHNLTYKDKTQSLAVWAREFKIEPSKLAKRLKLGWTVEKALTTK